MDILSETKPEKSFILSNGKVVKSLKELEQTLHLIDDEVFDEHVNVLKNDFYNWIIDVVGDKRLANDVARAKTRPTTLKKIKGRAEELMGIRDAGK